MTKIPTLPPITATITALSHDGRGITQINGKTTFIEGALPGETVTFSYTRRHGKYDEGRAISIDNPAAERAVPLCQHYTICGGCSLQHLSSEAQLQLKQNMLLEQLRHFGGAEPDILLPPITGPVWGYRHKARLGVKFVHKKNAVLVGFREKNGRYLADLERCVVLHPSVGELITPLKILISTLDAYQTIPQIEVAVSDTTAALVFRHMAPLSPADIARLTEFAQEHSLHLYLQPGGPQSTHLLWPQLSDQQLHYRLEDYQLDFAFEPGDFTQINTVINRQMIARAIELLALKSTDRVLDLFCGLGNFTLPIARYCAEIIGIEGSADLIVRATKNAAQNQISNAHFYQADLTTAFAQTNWGQLRYDKILLDPPRTGALEMIQQITNFAASRIVYVSCNPATLARDTRILIQQGYRLAQTGIMDMFPHTHHVEAIALFEKSI